MSVDLIWTIMEHVGVVAFAISGAIVAIDRETDIIGVVFLAFITTFGGGIIRDLLLGLDIPKFFTPGYTSLIIVCLATTIVVLFFAMCFKSKFVEDEKLLDSINNYIDAVGIGAFTVSGARLAVECGYDNPFTAIMMGMITCIGGGMIRDMMLNDIPFVLRKRIYALAAAGGAGVYYLIWKLAPSAENVAMIVGALTTITIRVLATCFKWNMPKAINFSRLRARINDSSENKEEEKNEENQTICK